MRKSDVIVIGGGLAGLTAALVAADAKRSVTLLAKGVGTLAFGGGVIDVLGQYEGHIVKNPQQEIGDLLGTHPYSIMGIPAVATGITYLQQLCASEGYPLDGTLQHNFMVPTAAGTLKPSCLVPKTMNATGLEEASVIKVVTFAGLKDFYPPMIINGLKQVPAYNNKQYGTVVIQAGLPGGRDVRALDIARWLDTEQGQVEFLRQLQNSVQPGDYLLLPPVLGTEPNYDLWYKLEQKLACRLIEVAAAPPAITGSRLRTLLLQALRKRGVRIIEQAHVRRAEWQDSRCNAVITQHLDRERTYEAQAFILATGGFLGGGLEATPQGIHEVIFDLPVTLATTETIGLGRSLFEANEVFKTGVAVDSLLRPSDKQGKVILDNVYLAGNILAGYDYCYEKSGNGVAVASGYQAALSATRSERI